jgi:hypothetical protein
MTRVSEIGEDAETLQLSTVLCQHHGTGIGTGTAECCHRRKNIRLMKASSGLARGS